jgi:hypothetical protein
MDCPFVCFWIETRPSRCLPSEFVQVESCLRFNARPGQDFLLRGLSGDRHLLSVRMLLKKFREVSVDDI